MAVTMEDVVQRLYDALNAGKVTDLALLEGPSFGRIRFTGWKPAQQTDLIVSQFCWYPPMEVFDRWREGGCLKDSEPVCYAACVPLGFCGSYTMGQSFDLTLQEGRSPITRKTPKAVVDVELHVSLAALIAIVISEKPEWLKIFDQNEVL